MTISETKQFQCYQYLFYNFSNFQTNVVTKDDLPHQAPVQLPLPAVQPDTQMVHSDCPALC